MERVNNNSDASMIALHRPQESTSHARLGNKSVTNQPPSEQANITAKRTETQASKSLINKMIDTLVKVPTQTRTWLNTLLGKTEQQTATNSIGYVHVNCVCIANILFSLGLS